MRICLYACLVCFLFPLFASAQKTNTATTANGPARTNAPAKQPTFSQSTDSLKTAMNDFKKSMNSLFGGKRDTIAIAIRGIDYDDANLNLLKEDLKKMKGVKSLSLQYKSSNAILQMSYKGRSTDLWDQLPAEARKPFKIVEADDSFLTLAYVK
jgi:hypothetical protein